MIAIIIIMGWNQFSLWTYYEFKRHLYSLGLVFLDPSIHFSLVIESMSSFAVELKYYNNDKCGCEFDWVNFQLNNDYSTSNFSPFIWTRTAEWMVRNIWADTDVCHWSIVPNILPHICAYIHTISNNCVKGAKGQFIFEFDINNNINNNNNDNVILSFI